MDALQSAPPESAAPLVAALVAGAALASLAVAAALVWRVRRGLPLIVPRPAPRAGWSGGDVAAVMGTVVAAQILAAALLPADASFTARLAASVAGMAIAAGIGAWHLRARGATWEELGCDGRAWREDLRLAAAGLALVLCPLLALSTLLDRLVPYRHPIIEYLATHRDPAAVGFVLLSAVVVAPLVEEFIFRRVLQGWLLSRTQGDATTAVLVQALAFGVAHAGQGLAPVPLTLFGIVLGWLTLRTGTLVPAVALHAAFNAVSIALVLSGVGDPGG